MLWSPVQTDTTQHGPARPLEPSPVPRVPSSPPRLRDTAASFPFAGSSSNEAEHLCQGHPGRTLIQPATQTTTDKALLATAPTHRPHVTHRHRQPSPLLPWGWQRQQVTAAGTHTALSGFTSTYTPAHLALRVLSHALRFPMPLPAPRPHGPPLQVCHGAPLARRELWGRGLRHRLLPWKCAQLAAMSIMTGSHT